MAKNMIDCISDFIGLKNCNGPAPESGLYINGLPGMSTQLADSIANSEQATYAGVWFDVRTRAHEKLRDDIVRYMYHDSSNVEPVNFNQTIYQTRRLKKSSRSTVIINSDQVYRGVYIKLPESKYVEFNLKNIFVFSQEDASSSLKVFDLNDSTELHTQEIELKKGLNTISVNKRFSMRYEIVELFIGVDASTFDTVETYLENYYWFDKFDRCFSCHNNSTLHMSPATMELSAEATYDNINRIGPGQGVALDATIGCSISDFICENKDILKRAIWYLLGKEMLVQKIGSPRLNFFTSSNLEQTDYLMKLFSGTYRSALKTAIDSIPMEKSLCFSCDELFDVGYKGNMP